MATVPRQKQQREGAAALLGGVSYKEYSRLTRLDGNAHVRMAYFDGTLEIMSPKTFKHESPSRRISFIITTVADALEISYEGPDKARFDARDGPLKGAGREPDQSFYFANANRLPTDRDPDLDLGEPPPDLWLEVDNRSRSRSRLPTYARLGVPEVWQYRVETRKLKLLRLVEGKYVVIDLSLALPVLTPGLLLAALHQGEKILESDWIKWLRAWATQFVAR